MSLLMPPAILPPDNAPWVRRVSFLTLSEKTGRLGITRKPSAPSADTLERVHKLLGTKPLMAPQVARELGLSITHVRRSLSALIEAGHVRCDRIRPGLQAPRLYSQCSGEEEA